MQDFHDAATVMEMVPLWCEDYNLFHHYKILLKNKIT